MNTHFMIPLTEAPFQTVVLPARARPRAVVPSSKPGSLATLIAHGPEEMNEERGEFKVMVSPAGERTDIALDRQYLGAVTDRPSGVTYLFYC